MSETKEQTDQVRAINPPCVKSYLLCAQASDHKGGPVIQLLILEMGRAPCCDKANVTKGPWSPEEDQKLKEYIEKNGTGGNWIALPHKAGLRRCGKSCRLRWLNYLRPDIKHGEFSDDEDRIICSLFASIGSRWSIIAAQLPGRTDNDIKNYWNTKLKKKLLGILPLHKQVPVLDPSPSSSSSQYGSSYTTTLRTSPTSHPLGLFPNMFADSHLQVPSHNFLPHQFSCNEIITFGEDQSCYSSDGSCNNQNHHKNSTGHHLLFTKQRDQEMGKLETFIYNGLEEISDPKMITCTHHYVHRPSATGVNELSLLDYELEEIKQLNTTNDMSNSMHNETNLFFTDPIDIKSGKPQERSPAMHYRL